MTHRDVPPTHRSFARRMRADATRAENVLWQALRGSQLEGLKFKRQVPIDGYIVDFVCFAERMIVEVDGAQHSESAEDQDRDIYFLGQGFKTVRFWNHEVEQDIDGVCQTILKAAGK